MYSGIQVGESFKEHSSWVRSVVFSPDGKQIASGSNDGTVRAWDAVTGSPCFGALKHMSSEYILSVAYSPDGRYIASAGNEGSIHIWDSQTGEHFNHLKLGPSWVKEIIFSPNGKRLACCLNSVVCVWELDDTGYGLKDHTGLLALDELERSSIRIRESSGKVRLSEFLMFHLNELTQVIASAAEGSQSG